VVAVAGIGIAAVSGAGATLGGVRTGEAAFLPFPVPTTPVARGAQQGAAPSDTARLRRLLQSARGANATMCELAATTVDGRSGWWSGHDGGFRAGGSVDSLGRDVVAWIQHRDVDVSAVPMLRDALSDPDWCVRRLAAPLLGRVRDRAASQAMLAALGSSDAGVREMGALALGFADDTSSVAPLVQRLRDDVPRVRATAAWALGSIEGREVVRPLIDALRDSDPMVRASVAFALGEVEDATAIPALTDLLKSDRDPEVRRAAALALGEIIG
jgi:HEAT repeat protein